MANISRHNFMKVAAGAAGIAGLGLLNGCSKTEAPASSAAASAAGSAAEGTTTPAAAAPATVEEMLAQPFYADASKTVNDLIGEATASIGEKISVRRFARFVAEHGMVDTYNHMGGRIGVMVELSCPEVNDEVKALSHDLVMHIAAANPQFVRRDEVPTDNLEKEREVLTQQALNEGKPAKIVERMVEGRIEKYYKEVCLMEQPFVKDPDKTIRDLISEATVAIGEKISIRRFVRYERGEGIEKRKDDFAAEIAANLEKIK